MGIVRDRDVVGVQNFQPRAGVGDLGLGRAGWRNRWNDAHGTEQSQRACVRAPLLELERAAFEGFNATAACGPAREGTGAYAYGSFPPARVASRWRCPVRAVAARMCVSPVRARRSVGRSVGSEVRTVPHRGDTRVGTARNCSSFALAIGRSCKLSTDDGAASNV